MKNYFKRGRHRKATNTARNTAAVAIAGAIAATGTGAASAAPLYTGGPRTGEFEAVTVVLGDTLSKIAKEAGTTWPEVFARNLDKIEDPNKIYPGQQLRIVGEPSSTVPVVAAKPVVAAPVKNQGVVAAAKSYLGRGIAYVWGGKSASQGFDCSGFVWQALKDAGHKVPYRTAAALKAWATPVTKANAQAGDLVFWPGHVEIYLGDGKTIGAANPQIDLGIHNIYGNPTFGRIPA